MWSVNKQSLVNEPIAVMTICYTNKHSVAFSRGTRAYLNMDTEARCSAALATPVCVYIGGYER